MHRLLKRIVQTGAQDDPTLLVRDGRFDIQRMVALGEHCSMTERRADEASRDVGQWLKCRVYSRKPVRSIRAQSLVLLDLASSFYLMNCS